MKVATTETCSSYTARHDGAVGTPGAAQRSDIYTSSKPPDMERSTRVTYAAFIVTHRFHSATLAWFCRRLHYPRAFTKLRSSGPGIGAPVNCCLSTHREKKRSSSHTSLNPDWGGTGNFQSTCRAPPSLLLFLRFAEQWSTFLIRCAVLVYVHIRFPKVFQHVHVLLRSLVVFVFHLSSGQRWVCHQCV